MILVIYCVSQTHFRPVFLLLSVSLTIANWISWGVSRCLATSHTFSRFIYRGAWQAATLPPCENPPAHSVLRPFQLEVTLNQVSNLQNVCCCSFFVTAYPLPAIQWMLNLKNLINCQYFTRIVVTAHWFPRFQSLVNWLAAHSILNITIYLELWQLIKWHSAITPWCPELLEVYDKISALCWNTLLHSTGDKLGSPLEIFDSEPGIAAWWITHHSLWSSDLHNTLMWRHWGVVL